MWVSRRRIGACACIAPVSRLPEELGLGARWGGETGRAALLLPCRRHGGGHQGRKAESLALIERDLFLAYLEDVGG